jgi:hypothetical protein
MKGLFLCAALVAGCASCLGGCATYSGSGLVPGQSTVQDVEAAMGEPALVREAPGGGQVLWYPRLPFGRESFAAHIDADGTLVSIEQRLDPQYIARLVPGKSTAEDVLDTLGPPYKIYQYPRKQREAWEYQLRTPPENKNLYVQLSPDRVVREVFQLNERDLDWPLFPFR